MPESSIPPAAVEAAQRTLRRLVDSCDGYPDNAYYDEEAMVTCGELRAVLTAARSADPVYAERDTLRAALERIMVEREGRTDKATLMAAAALAHPQSSTACKRCGRDPALGFATINQDRYCHGDEKPSCYEQAQHDRIPWTVLSHPQSDPREGT